MPRYITVFSASERDTLTSKLRDFGYRPTVVDFSVRGQLAAFFVYY